MEFANKDYLFLLLLIIPYIIWFIMFRKKSEPTIRMADTYVFRFVDRSWKVILMPLQLILRIITFALLVVVLARPQTHDSMQNENIEGIDIMLAMDVSTSMLAEDLHDDSRNIKNRIEAAKTVAAEFIAKSMINNQQITVISRATSREEIGNDIYPPMKTSQHQVLHNVHPLGVNNHEVLYRRILGQMEY